MRVHSTLGAGFLESVYQKALEHELQRAGISFEAQKELKVIYDSITVGEFAADLLVENELIVELKAVSALATAHEVQTVNYLVATGIDVGLLINFGTERLESKKKFRKAKSPTE
jgi:GxxExxY protein